MLFFKRFYIVKDLFSLKRCRFDTDLCSCKQKQRTTVWRMSVSGFCPPLYFLENQANYLKEQCRAAKVNFWQAKMS